MSTEMGWFCSSSKATAERQSGCYLIVIFTIKAQFIATVGSRLPQGIMAAGDPDQKLDLMTQF